MGVTKPRFDSVERELARWRQVVAEAERLRRSLRQCLDELRQSRARADRIPLRRSRFLAGGNRTTSGNSRIGPEI
jgi:hypothetical protein